MGTRNLWGQAGSPWRRRGSRNSYGDLMGFPGGGHRGYGTPSTPPPTMEACLGEDP